MLLSSLEQEASLSHWVGEGLATAVPEKRVGRHEATMPAPFIIYLFIYITIIGSAYIGKKELFEHADTPLAAASPKRPSTPQPRDEGVSQPKLTPC